MVEQVITVDGLRGRAEALRRLVADLSEGPAAKPAGGLHLFGRGTVEIAAGLRRLESRTRRSVWNVQPGLYLDPEDESTPLLDARSRRRGIDLSMLVDERAARANPLLASTERNGCRVAPVFLRMLVADGHVAVIEGLACASGEPTAWCAEGGEVAVAAVRLWQESHRISRPLPVPAAGLLTGRQVVVARAMCRAVPDQRLALQWGSPCAPSRGRSLSSSATSTQPAAAKPFCAFSDAIGVAPSPSHADVAVETATKKLSSASHPTVNHPYG